MEYQFPIINQLSDVQPAIDGIEGFIVAKRDWGDVVNYIQMGAQLFPDINTIEDTIRRECRGLIFCPKTGRITRRPLHKFMNIGERTETLLENLDFTLPHRVYTKLDGSMISSFEIEYGSRNIRWGTRMGITDVALAAEVFIAEHPKYQKFAIWCATQDITPIFEYTSPTNQIVIRYNQPMLTLLAARHMITGEYIPLEV